MRGTRLYVECLLLVALTSPILFRVELCQGQLEWSITTTIEISTEGTATWVIQQETVLTTESDEAAFLQYSNMTSVDEFTNHVQSIVDHASIATGRSMRAQNIQVKATVTNKPVGKSGVIQYQYEWIGFAELMVDEQMKIGDIFDGTLDLSQNDMLILQYPSGYAPNFITPPPDETNESERTIIWFGPQNLGSGEPTVLLGQPTNSWLENLHNNQAVISGIVSAITAGLVGYWIALQRVDAKRGRQDLESQPPPMRMGFEDDEDKVIRLLKAAGGRLYQSTITKETKFSKSKTSELLKSMEKKGTIKRNRQGRNKIVTLRTARDRSTAEA